MFFVFRVLQCFAEFIIARSPTDILWRASSCSIKAGDFFESWLRIKIVAFFKSQFVLPAVSEIILIPEGSAFLFDSE